MENQSYLKINFAKIGLLLNTVWNFLKPFDLPIREQDYDRRVSHQLRNPKLQASAVISQFRKLAAGKFHN